MGGLAIGLARGVAHVGRQAVLDLAVNSFVIWLLVYDSDFGRLPLFDEMLMVPSFASSQIVCCFSVHDIISLLDLQYQRSIK